MASDAFDSAFGELVDKLGSLDNSGSAASIFRGIKILGTMDSEEVLPGLLPGLRQLFRPRVKNPELEFNNGRITCDFWYSKCIKKLLLCIHKLSDARKVVPNWESIITKIEAAALDYEIAEDLRVVCGLPKQILDDDDESEKAAGLSKLEIGEALDHLSASCDSGTLKWHPPWLLADPSLCSEFLLAISSMLQCIWHARQGDQNLDESLREQIKDLECNVISPLRNFLQDALLVLKDDCVTHRFHPMIDKSLITRITVVGVKIANQSCHYWINRMVDPVVAKSKIVELLDMQHEIDPLTPEFLVFVLISMSALPKINPDRYRNAFSFFIHYIIEDKDYNIDRLLLFDLLGESEPLREDVTSLRTEIKAMILLLGVSSRGTELLYLSSPELQTKTCLLNVEVSLKKQLNWMAGVKYMEKDLKQHLKYLRRLLDQPQKEREKGNQTSVLVDEVAKEIDSIYQSFHEKTIKGDRMRISLLKVLLKIVLFQAESSCVEFQKFFNGDASDMGVGMEEIVTLREGLNLFNAFVANQQVEMTMNTELIFKHVEIFARGITSLYYSFIANKISKRMMVKMIGPVSNLLARITVIKAKLREFSPQIPKSNFPKTRERGLIDFLLENLAELPKQGLGSTVFLKHHIERIRFDLESLKFFLMKQVHQESNGLGTRVIELAHEAQYIIDSIEVGMGEYWQHLLWLHDLLEDIRLAKIEATDISEEKTCNAKVHHVPQISGHMTLQVSTPEIGEMVVCLGDVEDAVIDQLTRGSSKRDIVSIVGMPGIGKTTLAKKVYCDPRVTFHFHVRSWYTVSQVFAKRELLLDIISEISGFTDDMHQMTDEDLDLKLYQSLKQKRYLIVLDDVWDTGAWNVLGRSLPEDANGSRILITSRLHDVVLKAEPGSHPHSLRLLSDDESWRLLQMKIFHGGCPNELLKVGKEIATNCRGLPLAIVAIAGLLERAERKHDRWKKIAESLSTLIIDDPQTRCMDILQLSFKELPDHLKPCLLYFGAFLEDKDIPVGKLIRLWIAEGFVQKMRVKSLEELAEDYLTDLMGRSLVTVSKKGSRGRVKACHIHDLIRELCLSKAKEENFLQLITREIEPYASFSDLDSDADFYDFRPSSPVRYESHHVSIFLKRKHFANSRPFGPCTRSLLFFATSDAYPRRPYDISFIPRHFKLLKVLDLESINIGMFFPTGTELLVQLRYLAVSGDIDFIPPSIANLWKLETLIVKGLKGKVVLPDSMWSMARLRHLHVNDHVEINFQDNKVGSSLQLENLVSFSSPSLAYGEDTMKILQRLPNLRKLGCIYLESWDAYTNYNKFPVLDFLVQLESLKIFYIGRVLNPGEFTLPWNLKKLTVSNFRLPWIHICAIGRLQNLEVLKLLSRSFEGRRWEMREGEFLKLKYLKLDTLNIVQWNASSEHLPNLEQLVLRNCKNLEEVPNAFAEIPTLQMIEVQSCSQSTEMSVTNILEEGIEGLKITIIH